MNSIFITLFGIITMSLSAYFSRAIFRCQHTHIFFMILSCCQLEKKYLITIIACILLSKKIQALVHQDTIIKKMFRFQESLFDHLIYLNIYIALTCTSQQYCAGKQPVEDANMNRYMIAWDYLPCFKLLRNRNSAETLFNFWGLELITLNLWWCPRQMALDY